MIHQQAPAFSILSITSSVLSWISFMEAQYLLSFGVSIIGILSGIFAIRYYYYAGNQKRNQLNNNNGE
jgi:hypothetical protein